MLFLLGSIILTSWLTLSFKVVERFNIPVFQAIVFNYITCVITGSFVNGEFPVNAGTFSESWFKWSLLMGFMFVSIFNVVAATAQKMGVAIASVANKLSLVIPFIFSIYLYNETTTWIKIVGVVVALVAVVLTCMPSSRGLEPTGKPFHVTNLILPIGLFISSGLLDTLIKYVEQTELNDGNKNAYLITSFGVAAMLGIIGLLFLLVTGKTKFDKRSILAGIMIGVPNYFSIWCLVQVLKDYQGNSSAILPINNMGIVLFSTVAAWIFFRERLSKVNWLGIILSIAAIAFIAFG
ncbi:MAG: EamA family transporter [Chitinophagaceae bacterium]|nr:EamA family transporter [Chitinophagaceae bacterium]